MLFPQSKRTTVPSGSIGLRGLVKFTVLVMRMMDGS